MTLDTPDKKSKENVFDDKSASKKSKKTFQIYANDRCIEIT